ncbi:glutamyl-tRNA(Gln) amidotransferase subunit A [Fusarium pseudoanthophilum]|uniref:Glutamyl-tRNA(Gln) amidotransferase subunit A n=1 Tax=Fusarium pseudoanthophilum TaxID=48495 RepID=A0A8H5PSG1_9HYPO|nr:glutamyl-tRNA(Gln) amidotransferase subunit A [Fusarium pseudoanthophilum]
MKISGLLTAAGVLYTTALAYPSKVGTLDLLEASAKDVSEALARGKVTSLDLVKAYMERIEANNHKGLHLNAVIETAPVAKVQDLAKSLDKERAAGKVRSPLHGVPILVKDNYNTDPSLGMDTTAGSFVLYYAGGQAKGDAFVIKKLRDAGAIILGKSSLHVWSGFSGNPSSAWSPRGGQVSSPYVKGGFKAGGDPGGSSSGSGAGVSAGFVPLALGTDTEGSILGPSSRGALYGLRPSIGTTSRTGVVPISSSSDTTGPLGKTTWDVAATLSIMAGLDPEDPDTRPAEVFRQKDYTKFLNTNGFKGLRIGVVRDPFFQDKTTKRDELTIKAFDKALVKMAALGANVMEVSLDRPQDWNYTFTGSPNRTNDAIILTQYDFKTDISNYLKDHRKNSTITDLGGIINTAVEHFAQEYPETCCFPTFVAADQLGDKATSGAYWLGKNFYNQLYEEGPVALYREHQLDLLVLPSEYGAARFGPVGRQPVGSVPLGYDEIGLPFGMAFVGKRYDEGTVIRAMSAYEAHFPKRKVPSLLK